MVLVRRHAGQLQLGNNSRSLSARVGDLCGQHGIERLPAVVPLAGTRLFENHAGQIVPFLNDALVANVPVSPARLYCYPSGGLAAGDNREVGRCLSAIVALRVIER